MKTIKYLTGLLLGILVVSCSTETADNNKTESEKRVVAEPAKKQKSKQGVKPAFSNYIELGDLEAFKERGVLRLIGLKWSDEGLPRQGMPLQGYRILAEQFAERLGLKPQWILVDSFSELIPTLTDGKGDLIASHLTQTKKREETINFSLPLSQSEEQLLTLASAEPIELVEDLQGKRIVVLSGSTYLPSLLNIQEKFPEIKFEIHERKRIMSGDAGASLLTQGFDATVLDSDVIDGLLGYRNDIRRGLTVSEKRPIAWAMRKSSPDLRVELNRFLTESKIRASKNKLFTDDFDSIQARKSLRLITRNSPATYFIWRGELMGFEYELVKNFAKKNKLRLEVVVVPPDADPIKWLKEGRGDLIASAMTITDARKARGVNFTRYYNKIHEQFASNSEKGVINALDDLAGRTLVIRKSSAYWQTAKNLLDQGYKFNLIAAPDSENSEEILQKISDGEYDATIIDSHLLAIESKFLENVSLGMELEPAREHGWAVRRNNPLLLDTLNAYIKKNYRGRFFNVVYNKYYKNERRIGKYQGQRLSEGEKLSPYDELVKPVAEQFHFDWRMVVSQMYQESQFNPKARSFAGARGLLQVMPRTAKELGYSLPFTPQTGISAGVEYLDWTRDRFEDHLPLEERLWFSLAAYNAGFGHVRDARKLARQKGWDSDKWFNNVERAMLLLSKREYYKNARFGYVRGAEPVNYVRGIYDRYYAYLEIAPN